MSHHDIDWSKMNDGKPGKIVYEWPDVPPPKPPRPSNEFKGVGCAVLGLLIAIIVPPLGVVGVALAIMGMVKNLMNNPIIFNVRVVDEHEPSATSDASPRQQ
jgi:hypothetical protein